ncbi:MAG TPA: DUF697 domain-containing protein [Urbifossiella sp.]|jgi:uncharacterized protein (DUF697 family)|nr:DUF697 domain-containing protein [Urbifossiella sp.]
MSRIWDVVRRIATGDNSPPPDLDATLTELRAKTPAPVFWLLGKTQSGKTSITRYLTGADEAVIGSGYRPCTRTSRRFQFPTPEAPLLEFLDTRGVDEPGYDPAEDIAAFDPIAHVVIVTAKATDFAQGNIRAALETIRRASPSRPVILCVTCLNEAIPRQPHPTPYPFAECGVESPAVPDALRRSIEEHRRAFDGLFDTCVPIDLTKPADGFPDPDYGGEALKRALLGALPGAYRQTLLRLAEATEALKEVHLRHAVPVILGYASMAASAGALPVPFLDLLVIPGIQSRMVTHLARMYGQPMSHERFKEVAASLGAGLVARQAVREVVKVIPYVGSVAGAAVAWASTYALGRAFCYYYQVVCEGHVPDTQTLRKVYHEQYAAAEGGWKAKDTERAESGS